MFRISQVIPRSISILLLVEIFMTLACFVAGGYLLELEYDPLLYLLDDRGWLNLLIVVSTMIGSLYFQDMYSELKVSNRLLTVQQLCTAVGVTLLVQSVLHYSSPGLTLPRRLMIGGSLLSLPVLTSLRLLYAGYLMEALGRAKVLFLGRGETVQRIAEKIAATPELGMTVAGYLDDNPDGIGQPVLGTMSDLTTVAESLQPDWIVVGLTERRQQMPVYALMDLKFRGLRIQEVGQTYETTHGRVSVKDLRPSDLVFSGVSGSRAFTRLQTLYSGALALLGGLVTLPVVILVWVLVKVTSPGPAIYSQVRSGLNGQPFKVYKFRSMRVDAEAKTGAVWASKNDPRITPLGRWLRLLRLDELPQFWNVLRGEMNLVGPRPERPEFVRTLQEQIPFYRQRLLVKPGLTGWAQINHKYGDTIEDTITKLEYDLYYIKYRNVSLDFYIMFQTVKVMLMQKGSQ